MHTQMVLISTFTKTLEKNSKPQLEQILIPHPGFMRVSVCVCVCTCSHVWLSAYSTTVQILEVCATAVRLQWYHSCLGFM